MTQPLHTPLKKYQLIAAEIANAITLGLLKRGEKLPSIRAMQATKQVNAATVFQAYYQLEAKGLITAKPRSGYFVTGAPAFAPVNTLPHTQEAAPTQLAVSDLVFTLLAHIKDASHVPFGSAFPSPQLFPLNKLAEHMALAVKHISAWDTVNDIGQGDVELRRQIALRYQLDATPTSLHEIVICNGALEALNLCLSAVTQPGDTVIIESPSFYAALQSIERQGLRAVEITSNPDTGIDLAALERAISQHQPKAIWLMTNFQNPTGSLMPTAHKQALVALITRYQIPLIEDDVYRELYFGKTRPLPAKAFDTEGWVMHCSSFSKCLAPGYRVGWVSAGRFTDQVVRLKLSTSLATSLPAQRCLAGYLAKGGYDKHLRQLRHQLMLQQLQYAQAIRECFPTDTRLNMAQGGYFMWLQLPDHVQSMPLFNRAISHNISLAPGQMFASGDQFASYIRLNYGHAWQAHTRDGLQLLGRLMAD